MRCPLVLVEVGNDQLAIRLPQRGEAPVKRRIELFNRHADAGSGKSSAKLRLEPPRSLLDPQARPAPAVNPPGDFTGHVGGEFS